MSSTHPLPAQHSHAVSRGEGFELSILPAEIGIDLYPARPDLDARRVDPLWHLNESPNGARVIVKNDSATHRKVLLFVTCEDGRFQDSWVHWKYEVRNARESKGGEALDAQDRLIRNCQALVLYLYAGETRSVLLYFRPVLDEASRPGSYRYSVVAKDLSTTEIPASFDDEEQPRKALLASTRMLPTTVCPALVTVRHPSSRLLDQLPSIYRESLLDYAEVEGNPQGAAFFERFLLGFEDVVRPMIEAISSMERLFGAFSTPPDYLVWLAGWVCMPIDENWPEMKRRRLISEAVQLYNRRGTKLGLERFIEIYTGVLPRIDDQPIKGMRLGPQAKLGTKATQLGDVKPHSFVVTIVHPNPGELKEALLREIIGAMKPAHTAFTLRLMPTTVTTQ